MYSYLVDVNTNANTCEQQKHNEVRGELVRLIIEIRNQFLKYCELVVNAVSMMEQADEKIPFVHIFRLYVVNTQTHNSDLSEFY